MVYPPPRGLVSHCLPTCVPLLDGVSAVVPPLVSQFVCLLFVSQLVFWPCLPACLPARLPSCFPLLDGVPASREAFSPLSPSLSPMLSPSLSSGLVSQLVFLLVSLGWMVCLSSRGLVSQLVCQLVSRLSPSFSSFLFPFVGWCVLPSRSLVSLVSQLVSQLASQWSPSLSPSLFPILSSSLSPSSSSFLIFLFPLVGWCVHFLEALSPLCPSLSSFFFSLCFSIPSVATKLAKLKNNLLQTLSRFLPLLFHVFDLFFKALFHPLFGTYGDVI